MVTAIGYLNMRTMFALHRQKSPHGDYSKTSWSFKPSLIANAAVAELLLTWQLWSGVAWAIWGSKAQASLLGAHRSPESVTPFWLQLCQDPLSGTKLLSGIILWCSHCGEFNLGNTDTAESFIRRDDGWARFQMQRTLTFRPEHFCWSRPWASPSIQDPTNQKIGGSNVQLDFQVEMKIP